MEGKSLDGCIEEVKEKFITVYMVSITLTLILPYFKSEYHWPNTFYIVKNNFWSWRIELKVTYYISCGTLLLELRLKLSRELLFLWNDMWIELLYYQISKRLFCRCQNIWVLDSYWNFSYYAVNGECKSPGTNDTVISVLYQSQISLVQQNIYPDHLQRENTLHICAIHNIYSLLTVYVALCTNGFTSLPPLDKLHPWSQAGACGLV